jgi:iron complex outermembrane receptor protein
MCRSNLLLSVSACVLGLAYFAPAALAQEALPEIDVGSAGEPSPQARDAGAPAPPGFSREKLNLPVYRDPTGQTFTTIRGQDFENSPLVTIRDLLQYSPGVSFKQGNGPRDVVISIRGSAARNGFGVRNIVLMEDGFSVTQPDGLSRTDLTDPHAYAGVDVYRGPSSALFGNFANGGAINFRTRTGAEIDGVETGHDFGSFGYINNYTAVGKNTGNFDIAAFISDVRQEGFILHHDGDTQTVNMTARYKPTPDDLIVFKGIHNELFGNLSTRLSLNQYYANPYQWGCNVVPRATSTLSTLLCGQQTVPLNGVAATNAAGRIQTSPSMAGFHRNDRRDVFGLRWEHDFDKDTKWRTQVIYDDKNINQPTGATSALQDEPAVNASTDITKFDSFMGHDVRHYLGLYFNRTRYVSYTANTLAFGDGAIGATTNKQNAMMQNMGVRGREELALSPDVTMVLGLAAEQTRIAARSENYGYSAATARPNSWQAIPANHTYWNFAPEASITWRATPELLTHVRASSGYGTPNPGQLFINQQGLSGDNSNLKSQRNTGFDVGVDWTPTPTTLVSFTLYHEWYQNEQLTQTPGAGLQAFTFNAPGSVHRGAELLIDWRPFEGWRMLATYTYMNQIFTDFTEQLGPASFFNRAGYKIPNIAPHEASLRVGYDHPYGDFKGLGAYVEYLYKSSYYLDNGNQLTIPSYGIVNFNLHYDSPLPENFLHLRNFAVYLELENAFNRHWIASANNITNSLLSPAIQSPGVTLANSTGSIYAGTPRAIVGGVKFRF